MIRSVSVASGLQTVSPQITHRPVVCTVMFGISPNHVDWSNNTPLALPNNVCRLTDSVGRRTYETVFGGPMFDVAGAICGRRPPSFFPSKDTFDSSPIPVAFQLEIGILLERRVLLRY